MQIDLAGQVGAIRLAATNALLPLYEAVVNSVEAIQDRQPEEGLVEITIKRSYTLGGGDGNSELQLLPEIVGFEIADNGVGFTDRHYTSFDTSFSTLKASQGGKGIGRLVWLKAFDSATLESVYEDGEKWFRRKFRFLRSRRGIEDMTLEELGAPAEDHRTVVKLHDFVEMYREAAPKGADTIGRRIVEHCLVMYMLETMPKVLIHDPQAGGTTIDLDQIYQQDVKKSSEARHFSVGSYDFQIIDVLLRASAESENAIHFCANKREVQSKKLSGAIAHADNPILVDGIELRYAACVTGALLDQSLNNERTAFVLDRANELALGESRITWDEVEAAALAQAAEYLRPRLEEAKQKAVERVHHFIDTEEPRYRILLNHRKDEVESLSAGLTDERLELELHRIHADWRHEAKADAAKKLKGIPDDPESFAKFQSDFREALGELTEVVKADLAEYVVHRRMVLDFFHKVLGVMDSGSFAREDVLHELFFPLRTDSSEVDYDDHNLWLLDERLVFHHYLASDTALDRQTGSPAESKSKKRPDLLIFNQRFSFSEQDLKPYYSVVIVEFKKPERKDYTDSENPVKQIYGYIRDLRAGKAKTPHGATIEKLPESVRFFCHVVVTLTPKLREILEDQQFRPSADGEGYYAFNEALNAYVEVSDYQKVLHDAVKRNKAFFRRLGLHTSAAPPKKHDAVRQSRLPLDKSLDVE
ncbi:MAG: hypothetical protein WD894_03135 [Pirellulales bacterium]